MNDADRSDDVPDGLDERSLEELAFGADDRWVIKAVMDGGERLLEAVHHMSQTTFVLGQFRRAEFFAREGIGAAEEQGNAEYLARCRICLGQTLIALGRNDEGLAELHAAYDLADGIPLRSTSALFVAMALALAYKKMGRTDEEAKWNERLLNLKNTPKRHSNGD